jgi:Phage integrase family
VNGVAHVFGRAVTRAGITGDDVTLHTLRHTALRRMIAGGYDDYTVMEISGHSSTRMLARYTHPTDARKIGALSGPRLSTQRAQSAVAGSEDLATPAEIREMLREKWWTAGGSNSRPPRCERGALPTELAAH